MYPVIFLRENIPTKINRNEQGLARMDKHLQDFLKSVQLCMKQPKTQIYMRQKNDILLPHIFSASASLKAMPLQYIYLPDE